MDKVYVMDNRGREKEATKVRYFKYNDNCYFVYTLDEIDNEGYVKLYIKKMVGDEDRAITDDEWPNVKNIVQEVFKEIKAGTHYSYEDLNFNTINEIMDSGSRIFKLKKEVVDIILSKKVDENKALENDINIKLISEALKNTVNEEKESKIESIGPISETINENVTDDTIDLNNSLLNLLKRVEEVAKEENLFSTPDTLLESNKEDEIIEEKDDDIKIETDLNKSSSKIKPVIVGSVPVLEYKEKIEKLENEVKMYQDRFFNLKKELEQLKNENMRLHEEIKNSKVIVSKYINKIDSLKNIIKDI